MPTFIIQDQDQIEKGNVVSVHKEKAEEFLRRKGVDFPSPESFISYDDSIAYTLENVKYPKKNNLNREMKSEIIEDLRLTEVLEPDIDGRKPVFRDRLEVHYDLSEVGSEENNVDYKKVFEIYSENAKADDATALNNLGCCYINGEGTERNIQKAIDCFERAAMLGNSRAIVNLGNCALLGYGTEADPRRAAEYYRRAADLGSPIAFRKLAECYLNGIGTEKDTEKAVDLYKSAADLGDGISLLQYNKLSKSLHISSQVNLPKTKEDVQKTQSNPDKKRISLDEKMAAAEEKAIQENKERTAQRQGKEKNNDVQH